MNIAEQMREISNQNGAAETVKKCVEYNLRYIKEYAKEGRTRKTMDFFDGNDYISRDLRDSVRNELRKLGFEVYCPHEYSGGVMQRTEYIFW